MHEQDYHLISREITLIHAIYRVVIFRITVKYICTSPAADFAVAQGVARFYLMIWREYLAGDSWVGASRGDRPEDLICLRFLRKRQQQ